MFKVKDLEVDENIKEAVDRLLKLNSEYVVVDEAEDSKVIFYLE